MSAKQKSTPPPAAPEAAPAPARTRRLVAAAVLTAAEGAAIAVGGLWMLGLAVLGHPASTQQALYGGVTVLLLSLLPLSAARGLLALWRWSRGPAIATQIVALPVGWTMIQTGGAWAAGGAAVMALGLVTLVLLVNVGATDALGIRRTN